MFKIEIDTDGDHFQNDQDPDDNVVRDFAIATILKKIAQDLSWGLPGEVEAGPHKILDPSGNTCGSWEIS